jgi:hypothetical protein
MPSLVEATGIGFKSCPKDKEGAKAIAAAAKPFTRREAVLMEEKVRAVMV